jgi:hypothetical protein
MSEQKTVSVAIIEALSGLAWPIIAIVGVFLFRPPIEQILYRASTQLQRGASVELAGLKIELPKSNLPRPPQRVAKILPQLDSEELDYILTNVGDGSVSNCYAQRDLPDAFASTSAESRLNGLGLIMRREVLKAYKADDGTACVTGSNIEFEPIYTLTRNYLVDIIKSLQFGSSDAAET